MKSTPSVAESHECVRLRGIFKALNGRARLVLHGTNDFSPELSKACIEAGVSKFNVKVLIQSMERWMDIMGSSGKV